jgi:hypothetical protein
MKSLQISTFWLSNALFQLEFIRIVALEKVAGSSPVGHPLFCRQNAASDCFSWGRGSSGTLSSSAALP